MYSLSIYISLSLSPFATTCAEVHCPTNNMRGKMVVNHGLIMCEHQYLANIVVCLKIWPEGLFYYYRSILTCFCDSWRYHRTFLQLESTHE
jgi:hypothetical protein